MIGLKWYEAAQYCTWLSNQEGIPEEQWCYETNGEGEYGSGMRAKDNFLELTGYRLPTEAEWEFACRAETSTSRFYGVSKTLLPRYAWYFGNGANRTHPVASLKPNDFGCFDMLGNVCKWCSDVYAIYPASTPQTAVDLSKAVRVDGATRCVMRGDLSGRIRHMSVPQCAMKSSRASATTTTVFVPSELTTQFPSSCNRIGASVSLDLMGIC